MCSWNKNNEIKENNKQRAAVTATQQPAIPSKRGEWAEKESALATEDSEEQRRVIFWDELNE